MWELFLFNAGTSQVISLYFKSTFRNISIMFTRILNFYGTLHWNCRENLVVFVEIHQRLRKTGSFSKVYEMGLYHCSTSVEKYVMERMEKDPNVSMHTCERSWDFTKWWMFCTKNCIIHINLHRCKNYIFQISKRG